MTREEALELVAEWQERDANMLHVCEAAVVLAAEVRRMMPVVHAAVAVIDASNQDTWSEAPPLTRDLILAVTTFTAGGGG